MGRNSWVRLLVFLVTVVLIASCSPVEKQISFHFQPDGEQRGDEINLLRIHYLPADVTQDGDGPVFKTCPFQRFTNPNIGYHYFVPSEDWQSGYQLNAIASSPGPFSSLFKAPLNRRNFFIPDDYRHFLFYVEGWRVDDLAQDLQQDDFDQVFDGLSEQEKELLYANSIFIDFDDKTSISIALPLLPTDFEWVGASRYLWVDVDRDWFRNDMVGGDDCIDVDGTWSRRSDSARVSVRGCRFHPFAPREDCPRTDIFSCDCQFISALPKPSSTPRATLTASNTPTITPTQPTATPSNTPLPSPTPTASPTIGPSPTSDFHPLSKATMAAPAQCPAAGDPTPPSVLDYRELDLAKIDELIDFLNQGGSIKELASLFDDSRLERAFLAEDLTHDGVPEIIFSYPAVDVFGCADGRYERRLRYFPGGLAIPGIGVTAQDLNGNSVPELIIESRTMGAHNYTLTVQIFEWNGTAFTNQMAQDLSHPLAGIGQIYWEPGSAMSFNGDLFLADVDLNGTIDLELRGGLEGGLMTNMSAPQLSRRQIWKWNGHEFTLTDFRFAEPTIKFHAAWLGDVYSRAGEYSQAIGYYQQAIFDTELQAWNAAWNEYGAMGGGLDPYPTRPPQDLEQGKRISAYARYRQLLVHHILDNEEAIKIQYQSLQEAYPEGSSARAYAEMAQVFRQAYLEQDGSMAAGCQAAQEFADRHQDEVLRPLGPSIYGSIWPVYLPEDICPFGD